MRTLLLALTLALYAATALAGEPELWQRPDARAALAISLALSSPPKKAAPQCPCPDACRCPGSASGPCGCGAQRRRTACNSPCACGCQDSPATYCRCGEPAARRKAPCDSQGR